MDDYVARTIEAYDDTETYETSTNLLVPEVELDEFLTMLEPGSRILDAGCAYGRDTGYMQSKGFILEGIDLSPALIKRAKELYSGIPFKVSDVRTTHYEANAFDGVWCYATLLHLKDEDIDKALLEFERIMKPGAVLAVSFKKGEGTEEFIEKFSSKSARFFNYKTHETLHKHLSATRFQETAWHYLNERERYGQDNRDLDWLYSISIKA